MNDAVEAEINALSERYGIPQRIVVRMPGQPFDPLSRSDRYGEVCMVVRRTNGRLVAARKTFYPPNAFRLLTGGVHHGESIEAGLLRETHEETGLEVVVRRFLAVIEYHQEAWISPHAAFVTFAFLLDEVGGVFGVIDDGEEIDSFREVTVEELPALADALSEAPDEVSAQIGGNWRDWGRFRAIAHRVIYEQLRDAAPHHE